jgi:hypothetical protein
MKKIVILHELDEETHAQRTERGRRIVYIISGLVALAIVGFLSFRAGVVHGHIRPDTPAVSVAVKTLQVSDIDVYDLWNQTNEARAQNNLPALSLNPLLNASASAKCNDMVAKDYWSHIDPTGMHGWHFITEAGISYITAGENLAYGYDGATGVVNGWMNSEEHKANILNAGFTDVGFAVCKSGDFQNKGPQLLVVQHFVKL